MILVMGSVKSSRTRVFRAICTTATVVIGHDGQIDLYSNPERSGFVGYMNWFDGDSRAAVCKLTKNYRGWVSQHDAVDFDFAAS